MDLSHKKLDVWKFSIELIDKIYCITKSFPNEELFGLTNQMRRASVSVASNIAEGLSRTSNNEKCRFLEIASSSLVEIDTQIEISLKLKYCTSDEVKELESIITSIFAMISALIKKLSK